MTSKKQLTASAAISIFVSTIVVSFLLMGSSPQTATAEPRPFRLTALAPSQQSPELAEDGGFEAGTPNPFWVESSTNFGTPICDTDDCGPGIVGSGAHSGDYWVWFGGIQDEVASVSQDVMIPAGISTLSFWLEIPDRDPLGTGSLQVSIDGNVILDVTETDQPKYVSYKQVILDISAYADGGAHSLSFDATVASSGVIDFLVDDVSLTSCPDFVAPDKQVTLADVQAVASAWRALDSSYDCDGDGVITVTDILCAVKRLGDVCHPAGPAGIYGQITANGVPADDLTLTLRIWQPASGWLPETTTTTGPEGYYNFTEAPSLDTGEKYDVLYGFNTANANYLYAWYGPDLTSYTQGDSRAGGDFDVANVTLVSPPPQQDYSEQLPVTFEWTPRGLSGDTYGLAFGTIEPDGETLGETAWVSGDLGNVDSFTLTEANFPVELDYNEQYGWYVEVYNDSNGFGASYYYREITFLP